MRCAQSRELLSARLDGEATADECAVLDRHLASCAGCRAVEADLLHLAQATRLRPADAVPDLTAAIMGAVPLADEVPDPRRQAARWGLVIVAVAQLAVTIPALLASGDGGDGHLTRELASWSIALAVGLLVAAWQPNRARGMLPIGLALAAGLTLVAVVDIATGQAAGTGESVHALELAGVGLLWLLSRHERVPEPQAAIIR